MITFDRLACAPCCLKTLLIDRKVPVLLGMGMPSCEQDDIYRVRACHLCYACLSSDIRSALVPWQRSANQIFAIPVLRRLSNARKDPLPLPTHIQEFND